MTHYKIEVPKEFSELSQESVRELGLYSVLRSIMETGAECQDGNYKNLDLTLAQAAATICRLALEGDQLRRKKKGEPRLSDSMLTLLDEFGQDMMQEAVQISIKRGMIEATEIKMN